MGDQILQTSYIPMESAKLNPHQLSEFNRRINSQISFYLPQKVIQNITRKVTIDSSPLYIGL